MSENQSEPDRAMASQKLKNHLETRFLEILPQKEPLNLTMYDTDAVDEKLNVIANRANNFQKKKIIKNAHLRLQQYIKQRKKVFHPLSKTPLRSTGIRKLSIHKSNLGKIQNPVGSLSKPPIKSPGIRKVTLNNQNPVKSAGYEKKLHAIMEDLSNLKNLTMSQTIKSSYIPKALNEEKISGYHENDNEQKQILSSKESKMHNNNNYHSTLKSKDLDENMSDSDVFGYDEQNESWITEENIHMMTENDQNAGNAINESKSEENNNDMDVESSHIHDVENKPMMSDFEFKVPVGVPKKSSLLAQKENQQKLPLGVLRSNSSNVPDPKMHGVKKTKTDIFKIPIDVNYLFGKKRQ